MLGQRAVDGAWARWRSRSPTVATPTSLPGAISP